MIESYFVGICAPKPIGNSIRFYYIIHIICYLNYQINNKKENYFLFKRYWKAWMFELCNVFNGMFKWISKRW